MIRDKSNHRSVVFLLIGMLAIASPCNAETSTEEIKKQTQDLLQSLKGYTIEQKGKAARETKAALDKLDKRIDALEARVDRNWDEMDTAARNKARASLRALRQQRSQVAEWYGAMKNGAADAWEHLKKGFSESYKALTDAWGNSEKELGAEK